jgi:hypothetical protein
VSGAHAIDNAKSRSPTLGHRVVESRWRVEPSLIDHKRALRKSKRSLAACMLNHERK